MGNINYRLQNNGGMSIIRDVQSKPNYSIVNNNKNIDPGKRFNKKRNGADISTGKTSVADIISSQLRKKKG